MQEKKTVHDLEVLTINGEDLYLDKDGNVVHRERRNKKKLFADANKKIKDKVHQEDEMELAKLFAVQQRQKYKAHQKEMELAQLLAVQQRQND